MIYSLVGGWATPLKNMKVLWKSVGMMKSPIYGKLKNVPNHQPDCIMLDCDLQSRMTQLGFWSRNRLPRHWWIQASTASFRPISGVTILIPSKSQPQSPSPCAPLLNLKAMKLWNHQMPQIPHSGIQIWYVLQLLEQHDQKISGKICVVETTCNKEGHCTALD